MSSVAFIRDLSPSCFAQLTLRELVQIKVGINNAHYIAANKFTVTLRRQETADVVRKVEYEEKELLQAYVPSNNHQNDGSIEHLFSFTKYFAITCGVGNTQ